GVSASNPARPAWVSACASGTSRAPGMERWAYSPGSRTSISTKSSRPYRRSCSRSCSSAGLIRPNGSSGGGGNGTGDPVGGGSGAGEPVGGGIAAGPVSAAAPELPTQPPAEAAGETDPPSAVDRGRNGISRQLAARVSSTSTRPNSGSPIPAISFIASFAMIAPTCPHSAPSTPPSAQEGTEPSGGWWGNRSRSVRGCSPFGGRDQNTEICASERKIEAQMSGTPSSVQASLTR